MADKKIIIIDDTLREGMQYRGVVFSPAQRLRILDFQEKLAVDICKAGYPPAHDHEADIVRRLCRYAQKNRYNIQVAAMGRATLHDAHILLNTHTNDLHFHIHIKNDVEPTRLEHILNDLLKTVDLARKNRPNARISLAMLDIGRSENLLLEHCLLFLNRHHIDMVSLPDTSGMMAPNQVFEKIDHLASKAADTAISIHCHNDMGMATANSVMGILAGGSVLEVSALGIGERNGIADLYSTAKILKDQGFSIALKTEDIDTFYDYYHYVDDIVYQQTREHVLTANTPFFGEAVKTHVAGTHAGGAYGISSQEQFFLNVLCGKGLVKKYLESHDIAYSEAILDQLTALVKTKSAQESRRLTREEIKALLSPLQD